jgi:hypothetical protein
VTGHVMTVLCPSAIGWARHVLARPGCGMGRGDFGRPATCTLVRSVEVAGRCGGARQCGACRVAVRHVSARHGRSGDFSGRVLGARVLCVEAAGLVTRGWASCRWAYRGDAGRCKAWVDPTPVGPRLLRSTTVERGTSWQVVGAAWPGTAMRGLVRHVPARPDSGRAATSVSARRVSKPRQRGAGEGLPWRCEA